MKVLLLIIQEFKITNDTIMFIVKKKTINVYDDWWLKTK